MGERYGVDIHLSVHTLSEQNKKYLKSFQCGHKELDRYFQEEAATDQTAVTYLFVDVDEDRLVACVTLSCSAIFVDSEKEIISTIIPAMEIEYFAVDVTYQHIPYYQGSKNSLSVMIMRYMLDIMFEMSHEQIGAEKVVLYAVRKAVGFYKKCLFKEFGERMIPDEGYYVNGCLPMYFDLN